MVFALCTLVLFCEMCVRVWLLLLSTLCAGKAIALVATYMEIQVGNQHPTAALYIGTHKLAKPYAGTLGIANR